MNPVFLSVIVPVLDDSSCLGDVFCHLVDFCFQQTFRCEIVCVFTGDQVAAKIRVRDVLGQSHRRLTNCEVHWIEWDSSLNWCESIQQGMAGARGEFCLVFQGDVSVALNSFPDLMKEFFPDCGLVIGSRFSSGAGSRHLQGGVCRWLAGLLTGLKLRDMEFQIACFRRAAILEILPCWRETGALYQLEIIFLLHKSGWQIREVPVAGILDIKARRCLMIEMARKAAAYFRLCARLDSLRISERLSDGTDSVLGK